LLGQSWVLYVLLWGKSWVLSKLLLGKLGNSGILSRSRLLLVENRLLLLGNSRLLLLRDSRLLLGKTSFCLGNLILGRNSGVKTSGLLLLGNSGLLLLPGCSSCS